MNEHCQLLNCSGCGHLVPPDPAQGNFTSRCGLIVTQEQKIVRVVTRWENPVRESVEIVRETPHDSRPLDIPAVVVVVRPEIPHNPRFDPIVEPVEPEIVPEVDPLFVDPGIVAAEIE